MKNKNVQVHGARFSDGSTTLEIQADWWGPDDKVVIRKFTYGENTKIQQMSVAVTRDASGVSTSIDLQEISFQTLFLGLKSWTFTDPSGSLIKKSRDVINKLNQEDADWILEEIGKFNKPTRATQKQVDEALTLWKEEEAKGEENSQILKIYENNYLELKAVLDDNQEKFQETG